MTLVLEFTAAAALDPATSGGKGANLARLTQHGFPVPAGFIVTAPAYEQFLAAATQHFQTAIPNLAFAEPAVLEEQCRHLQEDLRRLPVPASVITAIGRQLTSYPQGTAFSVRSSATTEDMGGAAFAGQHETYLNCAGLDRIIDRVKDCWLSLWSARAVTYRHSAGFALAETSMAIVIQQMAFCDVAGVGFSIDPVSGRLDRQVFDANYGLGESVVGGEVPIDHFTVDKTSGLIVAALIGAKDTKIVALPADGTSEEQLSDEQRNQACLSERQIAALSSLLNRVERLYGFPQDIEWGFVGSEPILLQSRPITRIPSRWTREESAERFPSVITPLAWALVEEGFHKSLNHSFALIGLPPFHDKWFAMFEHYIYGNQNAVEIYANGAATDMRFSSLADVTAAIPRLRKQYAWVLDLPMAWSRDLDHYLMGIGELMAEPLADKSIAETWDFVLRVKELGAEYFLPNIAISITQRTLYRILLGLLHMAVGPDKAMGVFDSLLAYCETKTGAINKELFRMSRSIAAIPELADRLRTTEARAFVDAGGFGAWPQIAASFAKFLRDHGHREVEFDPYHPTWIDAPWLVVDNLKAMMDSTVADPDEKERQLKMTMRDAEAAVVAALPPEVRYFVQEVIRLARTYTTLDDVEHYQTTRLTLPFRKGLHALGRHLVERGAIDDPMDVFFARYDALDEAIRKDAPARWESLRHAITEEKQAYRAHRQRTPPETPGMAESAVTPPADALIGLPGSPGTATGPIFKVFDSSDFAAFPTGAVLVARTTNPAWTPLFYKAVAVITESGGPLSHGAVTAREIGLPAVMSVRNALRLLENGCLISVDGTNGRVIRAN